jgi:hypothetical protein
MSRQASPRPFAEEAPHPFVVSEGVGSNLMLRFWRRSGVLFLLHIVLLLRVPLLHLLRLQLMSLLHLLLLACISILSLQVSDLPFSCRRSSFW